MLVRIGLLLASALALGGAARAEEPASAGTCASR
jgi:hypothetical protein